MVNCWIGPFWKSSNHFYGLFLIIVHYCLMFPWFMYLSIQIHYNNLSTVLRISGSLLSPQTQFDLYSTHKLILVNTAFTFQLVKMRSKYFFFFFNTFGRHAKISKLILACQIETTFMEPSIHNVFSLFFFFPLVFIIHLVITVLQLKNWGLESLTDFPKWYS